MTLPVVLLVDDEPNVREALRRTMRDHAGEWISMFAANGAEAIEIIDRQPVAVVVTDIAMPVMDGRTLITHLYQHCPDMVTVVLSGHWTPAMSRREVGPNVRFLAKPASRETLAAAIRDALTEARLTGYSVGRPAATGLGAATGDVPRGDDANWVSRIDGPMGRS